MLLIHILLSLAGIFSGFVVAGGLLANKRLEGATALFLITNILTSLTGFALPATRILPAHIFAVLALIALALAAAARYLYGLGGAWRGRYVVASLFALYLNVFVLIVQLFNKTPGLQAYENQAPFFASHFVCLLAFLALGKYALGSFER